MPDPTPSQMLLLQAALQDPSRGVEQFRLWLSHNKLDDIRGPDLRLLPVIFNNLGRLITDEAIYKRLAGVARHVLLSNRLRMERCGQSIDLLTAQGIPTMLLKGSAMIATVANDIGHRMMSDCDMLVRRRDAQKAVTVMSQAGLRSIPMEADKLTFSQFDQLHGLTFRTSNKADDLIDLHWRPLREIESNSLNDEMFSYAKEVTFARRKALVPCYEHMLFQTVIHGDRWVHDARYDWLVDAVLILRHAHTNFDWDRLISIASRHGCKALLHHALDRAATLAAAPIPRRVLQRLTQKRFSYFERYEVKRVAAAPSSSTIGDLALTAIRVWRSDSKLTKMPIWLALPSILRKVFEANEVDLSASGEGNYDANFIHGWSFFESTGRWTDGKLALLNLSCGPNGAGAFLRLMVSPIVDRRQRIDAFIGWHKVGEMRWLSDRPGRHSYLLPIPSSYRKRKHLHVWFRIHRPVVPEKLQLSSDQRNLGLRLLDIRVFPPIRDAATKPICLSFGSGDEGVLWNGWSFPAKEGTWTESISASLRWRVPVVLTQQSFVVLKFGSYRSPGGARLKTRITLNGRSALDFEWGEGFGPEELKLLLKHEELNLPEIQVQFDIERAEENSAAIEQNIAAFRIDEVRIEPL